MGANNEKFIQITDEDGVLGNLTFAAGENGWFIIKAIINISSTSAYNFAANYQ